MKWYEQRFVSHRDWILDHLELLGLNADEAVICLLVDFMNEKGLEVSTASLAAKTGKTEEETDRIVSVLCAKKYMEIRAGRTEIRWSLDGLFETNIARVSGIEDSSLFDVFESEFGRTLNEKEMEKISEWNRTTDKKLILYALRSASAYRRLNLAYIDKILSDWKSKGVTVESIERNYSR